MEPDAVYFTSILKLFLHLKSSFNFLKVLKLRHINVKPGQEALIIFLSDIDKIDKQYLNFQLDLMTNQTCKRTLCKLRSGWSTLTRI